jgi:hydroxymethylpyrimidine pyrophosphatase-like HAD family hydrolase
MFAAGSNGGEMPGTLRALATDYDGTIATEGTVPPSTLAALDALRSGGFRLALVTGRILADLETVFPHLDLFDLVVAENGASLLHPSSREEVLLAPPHPPALIEELRARDVPHVRGRVVVATWDPHGPAAEEALRASGTRAHVSRNKEAVMILPLGCDKETGLRAALPRLGVALDEVVAVGDAENDLPFLDACGRAVAVANALPEVKARVDLVTERPRGAGVEELAERLLRGDLPRLRGRR